MLAKLSQSLGLKVVLVIRDSNVIYGKIIGKTQCVVMVVRGERRQTL